MVATPAASVSAPSVLTVRPWKTGEVLVRQSGTHIHPGENVGRGKDDTLFALAEGKVKFTRVLSTA